MNRFIFPVLFGGILLVATFVLMLFQQMSSETAKADGDKVKSDKVEYETANNQAPGGIMFALQMMYEDMTGQTTIKTKVDVSGYVPAAPTGWFETPYKNEDGEAITQTSMIRTPIAKSSTNTMLMRFDALAQGKGNGFAKTYRRGEQLMAIALYVPDRFNERTIRGGIMAAVSSNMTGYGDFGKSREVFALHHGVPILEADGYVSSKGYKDDVPVDYRVFNGDIGGMFKFQVLTNSSDAAVADLLRALPVGEMIALLPDPEPHLLISAEFQTRDPEPSNIVPETPSIARRAYLLKKTRLDFSSREKDFLEDLTRRRIRSWDDAYEDYGTGLGVSSELTSLLGPMPALTNAQTVEYTARAYLHSDGWTEIEENILEGMERARVTERKDVDRYLKEGEVLADDVIALINLLPETYDAADASTSNGLVESPVSARELVIRRGTSIGQGEATFGNCKIELGVRRCVVGGTDGN